MEESSFQPAHLVTELEGCDGTQEVGTDTGSILALQLSFWLLPRAPRVW